MDCWILMDVGYEFIVSKISTVGWWWLVRSAVLMNVGLLLWELIHTSIRKYQMADGLFIMFIDGCLIWIQASINQIMKKMATHKNALDRNCSSRSWGVCGWPARNEKYFFFNKIYIFFLNSDEHYKARCKTLRL